MLDKIISYYFYLLFFLTPLFWTSLNHELFEFNKMFLTYGITVVIIGAWLLKAINDKRLTINRTPLDIPLLLFLGANILSTIFSIDTHTSIFGYYSRLNGGLLSIISYSLLYWAYVANMDKEKVFTSLKFALASGVIVSLWGILEHFGVSPSCVLLDRGFNASCWVQDVQARVFASLGQPNWMAGYLAMLIFPALYFFLTAKKKFLLYTFYFILFTLYLSFTFTYSRGPTLGLLAGLLIFVIFAKFSKPLLLVAVSFLVINILFGSALTSFKLIQKFAPPPRPAIALPATTQLETGGTESGQIRFIVWQGAWQIFKAYPVTGSGLETFAYSYYQFRPEKHNLTSEWDFLYNKAHNEYLNYLSTTGLVGFSAYIIMIITFIIVILRKRLFKNLLVVSLLASYVSYLVYNFFLFSVVILALFFYLFPALVFVVTDSTKPFKVFSLQPRLIYRAMIIFTISLLLFNILRFWYADTLFAKADKASDMGSVGKAYDLLLGASDFNKFEPLYRSELAFAAAAASEALEDVDASLSATLADQATTQTEKLLNKNPHNVSFFRTAVRTYAQLSALEEALNTLDKTIMLAPTDPKLILNKGLILLQLERNEEAKAAFQKALQLKPDYLEAKEQLDEKNK